MKIALINLLTIFRLISVIILYPVYLNFGIMPVIIISIISYLTDALDGFLARKFKATTFFGSIMDVVADKGLNIVSIFIIANHYKFAYIILLFELAIITINIIRYKYNQNLKTKNTGRIKMIVLGITVVLCYILINTNKEINELYIFSMLIILEFITFINYLLHFISNPKMSKKVTKKSLSISLKTFLFDHEYYENNKDKNYKNLLLKEEK